MHGAFQLPLPKGPWEEEGRIGGLALPLCAPGGEAGGAGLSSDTALHRAAQLSSVLSIVHFLSLPKVRILI